MIKVDNAIIMAAGKSSRFAPISYIKPKSLVEVKGEILIERQIKQLQAANIFDITIITGYKAEMFDYLRDKYQVNIIYNDQYESRNNNSSLYLVMDKLKNTYICSSDNYFVINPFKAYEDNAYYSCVYQNGITDEWCVNFDKNGIINQVNIGGNNQYVMLGHVLFDETFSNRFKQILTRVYNDVQTYDKLWEQIYIENIDKLHLKIKKYHNNDIYEFDSLDELREFDEQFVANNIYINIICQQLSCLENQISRYKYIDEQHFNFIYNNRVYKFNIKNNSII